MATAFKLDVFTLTGTPAYSVGYTATAAKAV
jgi:hypothetical protein